MSRMLRTQRGLDRLVNFSDATVAIAITLLLLPLVDAASDARADRVGEFLSEHQGTLIAFFVSFAVIARMWTMHHRLFEVVHAYSPRLMRVNLIWLASIAFLPFASNMLAAAGQNPAARALYIGTIAVASLTFALMEGVVIRDPSLRSEADRDLLTPTNSWLTFAAVLLALILTLSVPVGGVWWLLLLVPAGWVSDFLERRDRTRQPKTAG
ncbi:TMEM175 family protein [Mycetocola saprophilus]|uniref:TMEM175 family protein n=1 Tax=Mycetocola saprophilus TaxID=76636 RepID=UPI0009DF0FE5|nr:TMEM175 family protein [Mycetocola saprophilus]